MSEPSTQSDSIKQAREWLATAAPRWRLQTMQHRSRYNPKTGEYKQLPTRVRRFLNGTPAGMKAAVLQVLRESAPYASPVFDLECDGLEYVPTNTFIRKDGMEHVTNARDATYTIIQDLRLSDGTLDRFGFPDESSCSEYGETEYRWDEQDVEGVDSFEDAGSQGVVYQIADVSRDRETDLFSYRVRRVQALTQHTAPAVTQCDARKTVTVETWNNLYGEPGAFRWDPVKGGSAPVAIPEPCSRPDGTSVQVSVSENADCTYRAELTTVEARTLDGQFSVYRDQYKVQRSDRVQNAFAPLDRDGVEHSGGVTRRYVSEPNDDGTWNNSVETETERQVRSSTVEVRVMPRHTVTTRVDTNVPEAASAVPGGRFGSYKSTKTQGGLFVNEYVSYGRTALGDLGLLCTDTAFAKTHEAQATADSVPASGHVPPASGGLVTTWSYDTDAEGTVVRRVRTDQEHEVRDAVRRKAWGWLGTTSGYTHRSVARSAVESLMASQPAGTSVEARMTNGALWDVEVQAFQRVAGQSLGLDCRKTVFEHVHEVAVSAAAIGEEASDAGGGRTYSRSFRLDTATGAVTQTDTTTHELPRAGAQVVVRKTLRGVQRTVVDRNAASALPESGLAVGETRQSEVTPGGLYNNTRTMTTAEAAGDIGTDCQKTVFEHVDSTTSNQAERPPAEADEAGNGTVRRKTARETEEGTWDVTVQTTTERPQANAARTWRKTLRGTQATVVSRNAPAALDGGGLSVGETRSSELTPGGLYNNTTVTVTPDVAGEIGSECRRTVFEHVDSTTENQRNAPAGHATSAGGGKTYQRTARQTEEGTWDVVEQVTDELPKTGATKSWRKTLRGVQETTVDRNQAAPVDGSGLAVGETRTSEMTPGGLYNNTKVTVSKTPAGVVGESCEARSASHVDSVTENVAERPQVQHQSAAANRVERRTSRQTEEGTWDLVSETTVFEPRTVVARSEFATEIAVTTRVDDNPDVNPQAVNGTSSSDPNDHGSATTVVTEYTPRPVDSDWITWESTTTGPRYVYRYRHGLRVFKNLSEVPRPPSGKAGSVNVSINRYGLYDGSVGYSDLVSFSESSGGGGGGGGSQMGTLTVVLPEFKWNPAIPATAPTYVTKTYQLDVVRYYGTGNEGSEASDAVNAIVVPGIHLPSRTYIKATSQGNAEQIMLLQQNNALLFAQYTATVRGMSS